MVVIKIKKPTRVAGTTKTSAVDRLLSQAAIKSDEIARMSALLAQLDRIPDRVDAFYPLEWDERGLSR